MTKEPTSLPNANTPSPGPGRAILPTPSLLPRFFRRRASPRRGPRSVIFFSAMSVWAMSVWAMSVWAILLSAMLATACPSLASSPVDERTGFRVVVHPSNPLQWITRAELSDVFLGKVETWEDGQAIALAEPEAKSDLRCDFVAAVHDRSVESVRRHWVRLLTSGRQRPPLEADSDAEMLEWVASRPGAIGYVSGDGDFSRVKVIGVVGEPELIGSFTPAYTEAARRARVEGTVLLDVAIDESGRVADVRTVRGLPHGLTHQAVRAVRQFRYRPPQHQGRPVPTRTEVAIRFQL